MIGSNKIKLILSSVGIMLPSVFGIAVWNRLPDNMVTHWDADGVGNGQMTKWAVVFVLPLILLLVHWVCIFFTARDNKNRGQNKKVFGIVIWLTPVISLFSNGIIYSAALKSGVKPIGAVFVLIGLMFVVIGNYLPKCKQNNTIGIKIIWTLTNEEIWNVTHRFGGRLWFAGGFVILFCGLLPEMIGAVLMTATMIVLVALPTIYSYLYYKKQVKEGRAPEKIPSYMDKKSRIAAIALLSLVGVALVAEAVVMSCGGFDVKYNEDGFCIDGRMMNDIEVKYSEIDSAEYVTDLDFGQRTFGYGAPGLLMGSFKNDEFGDYTLYAYGKNAECVVIRSEGRVLVIGCKDDMDTRQLFDKIKLCIEE